MTRLIDVDTFLEKFNHVPLVQEALEKAFDSSGLIIDGDDLISRKALINKAYTEEKGMAEPWKSEFGVMVDWLASKILSCGELAELAKENRL